MTPPRRPPSSRIKPSECEDLLELQAKGHKAAFEIQAKAHGVAMAAADRAAARRDDTHRFLLTAALTILGGLVGVKLWTGA